MEVRLSKNEQRLYDLIPARGRRIDSEALAEGFYGASVPINGRVYIANMIRSLRRKTSVIPGLKLVKSTEGSGRRAIEVWVEPRA